MIPSVVERFKRNDIGPTDFETLAALCHYARVSLTSYGTLTNETLSAVVTSPDPTTATARIYRVSMDGVKSFEGKEIIYKGNPGIGLTIEGFEYSATQILKFDPVLLPKDYSETPYDSKQKIALRIPFVEAHRIGVELRKSQPSDNKTFNGLVEEWEG